MVGSVSIKICGSPRCKDTLKVWGVLGSNEELNPGEVGDAEHTYVTITPRLLRRPLDDLIAIPGLGWRNKWIDAAGFSSPANAGNNMSVAPPREEIWVACFEYATPFLLSGVRASERRDAVMFYGGGLCSLIVGMIAEDSRKLSAAGRPG